MYGNAVMMPRIKLSLVRTMKASDGAWKMKWSTGTSRTIHSRMVPLKQKYPAAKARNTSTDAVMTPRSSPRCSRKPISRRRSLRGGRMGWTLGRIGTLVEQLSLDAVGDRRRHGIAAGLRRHVDAVSYTHLRAHETP